MKKGSIIILYSLVLALLILTTVCNEETNDPQFKLAKLKKYFNMQFFYSIFSHEEIA